MPDEPAQIFNPEEMPLLHELPWRKLGGSDLSGGLFKVPRAGGHGPRPDRGCPSQRRPPQWIAAGAWGRWQAEAGEQLGHEGGPWPHPEAQRRLGSGHSTKSPMRVTMPCSP